MVMLLVELGKEHDDLIVLDADLAGATKTGMFKKAFPERHWDIGIAEANMTGIAKQVLQRCGKVPFISSFAMFAAGRAYEQVRNAIGYPHLNVKNRSNTRWYLCWRRRSNTPVSRRYRSDERNPWNGRDQSCR